MYNILLINIIYLLNVQSILQKFYVLFCELYKLFIK